MINLHYAKKELKGDIPKKQFIDIFALISYVAKKIMYPQYELRNDKVYLIACLESVHISEHPVEIIDFIRLFSHETKEDVFLQEYDSYETAYEVALSMMEQSLLCYRNDD